MKIYFLENENPFRNSSGGIMSYLVNLSNYLVSKNIKTKLLGVGKDNNNQTRYFSNFYPILNNENPSNFKYILALFRYLYKFEFSKKDIIHAQRPDMLVPAIFLARKAKLICSLHGAHDKAVFDKKGFLYGLLYSFFQFFAFRFADLLIAVDQETLNYYVKKYPFIIKKIKLVPISVDTNKFCKIDKSYVREKNRFSKSDKLIIFVGRLEKEKNIQFLIQSYEKVKTRVQEAKLILVGNGRDSVKIKKYVNSKSINDVIFTGEVSNDIIPELLNCANVFVFASLYEGSPTVIKEALSCNLPVVSVDVGDVKSVISDLDGCYLAERNTDDFSKKIISVLNSNKSFNLRQKALRYSNENISSITFKYYQQLF